MGVDRTAGATGRHLVRFKRGGGAPDGSWDHPVLRRAFTCAGAVGSIAVAVIPPRVVRPYWPVVVVIAARVVARRRAVVVAVIVVIALDDGAVVVGRSVVDRAVVIAA